MPMDFVHKPPPLSPVSLIESMTRNAYLVSQLTKREISARYRGSIAGMAWTILNPLILLAMYAVVFGVIFKTKWDTGTTNPGKFDYPLGLFAGLIVVTFFNECLNRSPTLILNNANFVKKVVFPLEALVPVMVFSALFQALASFVVLTAFYACVHAPLGPAILLAPLVLIPLVFMTAGICWFLASLGLFLRDMSQIMVFVTTIIMFVSPVFYPTSQIPVFFRKFIILNPIAVIIEQFRAIVLIGQPPDLRTLGAYSLAAILVCSAGYAWFQATRHEFADVI